MTFRLRLDQQKMEKPQLPLALQCSIGKEVNLTRENFLIDTGCSFSLIINSDIYKKLGRPKLLPHLHKAMIAGGKIAEFRVLELKVILETLDIDVEVTVDATVIPDQPQCLVGNSLLAILCKKSNTDLVFNYRQDFIEFRG